MRIHHRYTRTKPQMVITGAGFKYPVMSVLDICRLPVWGFGPMKLSI